MSWVLISVVAIIAWALVEMNKNKSRGGGDLARVVTDLQAQLAAAAAERERLTHRVENLEAIVTSDDFELEREAQRAIPAPGRELPEGGGLPPLAIEEHGTPEDDEARAARLARRVRGG